MVNSYYSGSSYYDEEVSARSNPPLLSNNGNQVDGKDERTENSNSKAKLAAQQSQSQLAVAAAASQNQIPQLDKRASQQMIQSNSKRSIKFDKSADENIPASKRSQTSENAKSGQSQLGHNKNGTTEQTQSKAKLASGGDAKVSAPDKMVDGEKGKGLPVFSSEGQLKDSDLKNLKVSDILQGNFAPIEIPMIEIPGTKPLIYNQVEDLLAEVNEKDEFMLEDEEEEFLMFTAEIHDFWTITQDGPFHTMRWRKKVRNFGREPQQKEEEAKQQEPIVEQPAAEEAAKDEPVKEEQQKEAEGEVNPETQLQEGQVGGSDKDLQKSEDGQKDEQQVIDQDKKSQVEESSNKASLKQEPLEVDVQENQSQQETEKEETKHVEVSAVLAAQQEVAKPDSPQKQNLSQETPLSDQQKSEFSSPKAEKSQSAKPPSSKPPSAKPSSAKSRQVEETIAEKPPSAKAPSSKPPSAKQSAKAPSAKDSSQVAASMEQPSEEKPNIEVQPPSEKPITPAKSKAGSFRPPSVELSSAKPPSAARKTTPSVKLPSSKHSSIREGSQKMSPRSPVSGVERQISNNRYEARPASEEMLAPPENLNKSLVMSTEQQSQQAAAPLATMNHAQSQEALLIVAALPEAEPAAEPTVDNRRSLPKMEPSRGTVEDPVIEKTRADVDDRIVLQQLDPARDIIGDPVKIKERAHTPNVWVQLNKPVFEKMEQVYVKEIELQWLNEEHYLHELAKQLPPQQPLPHPEPQLVSKRKSRKKLDAAGEETQQVKTGQDRPGNAGPAKDEDEDGIADETVGNQEDDAEQANESQKIDAARNQPEEKAKANYHYEYDDESYYDEEENASDKEQVAEPETQQPSPAKPEPKPVPEPEAQQPPQAKPAPAEQVQDSIAEGEKVVEVQRSNVEISVAILTSNLIKSKQYEAPKQEDLKRQSQEKSVKASQEKKSSWKAPSEQADEKSDDVSQGKDQRVQAQSFQLKEKSDSGSQERKSNAKAPSLHSREKSQSASQEMKPKITTQSRLEKESVASAVQERNSRSELVSALQQKSQESSLADQVQNPPLQTPEAQERQKQPSMQVPTQNQVPHILLEPQVSAPQPERLDSQKKSTKSKINTPESEQYSEIDADLERAEDNSNARQPLLSQPNLEQSNDFRPNILSESNRKVSNKDPDEAVQEAYGSVRVSIDQAYVTDDEDKPQNKASRQNDVIQENQAQSEMTMYNPGDIAQHEEKLSKGRQSIAEVSYRSKNKKSKPRTNASKASTIKSRKPTEEEKEFELLREQHHSRTLAVAKTKAHTTTTNSSTEYVRRVKQPKLMDKQKMIAKQQIKQSAESLPRNSQKLNLISADVIKTNDFVSQELIPKLPKKPRPPAVPEHLRASSQSPAPIEQLRESMEQASQASRKPRVPKVSELMPDAVLIRPSKMSQEVNESKDSIEVQKNTDKKFMHSPPQNKTAKQEAKKLNQTPSMTQIQKVQAQAGQPQILHKTPSRSKLVKAQKTIALTTPGEIRVQKNDRRDLLLQKLIKKKPAKMPTPKEIESKFGNVRVIKPTREEAMMRMTQTNTVEYESETRSYTTLPAYKNPNSPQGSTERRNNFPSIAPQPYNSRQPYEQQMVAQLFTVYRRERNQPPRHTLFARHQSNAPRDRSFNIPTFNGNIDDDISRSLFEPELVSNKEHSRRNMMQQEPFTTSTKSFNQGRKVDIDVSGGVSSISVPQSRITSKEKLQSSTVHPRLQLQKLEGNQNAAQQQSPFSPGSFSRATNIVEQAKTLDLDRLQMHQRVQMKNYITTNSEQQNSDREAEASDSISPERLMLNVPSGQIAQGSKSNISHNSSFQKLLKAVPSFVGTTSGRKQSVEAVPSARNKAAIYQMLQQNSQMFLKQEKSHIDGFRKAQKMQKKTLDRIITSNSNTQLAPPIDKEAKGNFTYRIHQAAKSVSTAKKLALSRVLPDQRSNGNLPQVTPAFYNTYAVLEEYGNGSNMNQARMDEKAQQTFQARAAQKQHKHMVPYMRMTNASDQFHTKRHSHQPTQSVGANGRLPLQNASAYPSISSIFDIAQDEGAKPGVSGIPVIESGRNRNNNRNKQDASNRSNFLPSFDSRGNVGIIEDSNEFTPFRKRLKSNFNAERDSIDEIEPGQSSNEHSKRHRSRALPSLTQQNQSSMTQNAFD